MDQSPSSDDAAAMRGRRSNRAINVPNILTLIRLLLTPLFIILLIRDQLAGAMLVFVLAGISDGLDGLIARCFDQRTVIGAYLDPVADKVLLASAYVCLAILGIIPAWLTVVVLSRDILIVIGIAIFTLTQKPYRVQPSLISKCTTAVQLAMVFVSLLIPDYPRVQALLQPLMWLTVVITTISGLQYVFIGMNILQQAED